MLFENNDYDVDILSLAGFDFGNQMKYYDFKKIDCEPYEEFLRGNMWTGEYVPYKNYMPQKLNTNCEREELLYKIMAYDFAGNDLNLYLDLHPEDQEVYHKFQSYIRKSLDLKEEYAKKYGPLTLNQVSASSYEWMKNPWPWDKTGGSMYV